MTTYRAMNWAMVASISGIFAVGFGAFGAHVLKPSLEVAHFDAYSTASDYHLIHSVALLCIALYSRSSGARLGAAPAMLATGTALFSGSLYSLAITGIEALGAVTPAGGLLLIAGWALTARKLKRP